MGYDCSGERAGWVFAAKKSMLPPLCFLAAYNSKQNNEHNRGAGEGGGEKEGWAIRQTVWECSAQCHLVAVIHNGRKTNKSPPKFPRTKATLGKVLAEASIWGSPGGFGGGAD